MPTTESAISREDLEMLIRDAEGGVPISPNKFTTMFMDDIRDLEAHAKVVTHTAELEPDAPQLQAFMRRSLQVVEALLELGFTPANALFWFRCFPISEFGRKTPAMVLSDDHADQVIQILKRIFNGDREGLGEMYESMRRDTQSIQEEILKDVKMISADEAARLCRLDVDGISKIDIARAVERTKRAIYIMKGKEPVFPAYQFDYLGPKRIIAGIIRTLSPFRSNWEIAVWLWGRNSLARRGIADGFAR